MLLFLRSKILIFQVIPLKHHLFDQLPVFSYLSQGLILESLNFYWILKKQLCLLLVLFLEWIEIGCFLFHFFGLGDDISSPRMQMFWLTLQQLVRKLLPPLFIKHFVQTFLLFLPFFTFGCAPYWLSFNIRYRRSITCTHSTLLGLIVILLVLIIGYLRLPCLPTNSCRNIGHHGWLRPIWSIRLLRKWQFRLSFRCLHFFQSI